MRTIWRREKDTTITLRVPTDLKLELKMIVEYYHEYDPQVQDKNRLELPYFKNKVSQSDIFEAFVIKEYDRLIDEGFISKEQL